MSLKVGGRVEGHIATVALASAIIRKVTASGLGGVAYVMDVQGRTASETLFANATNLLSFVGRGSN